MVIRLFLTTYPLSTCLKALMHQERVAQSFMRPCMTFQVLFQYVKRREGAPGLKYTLLLYFNYYQLIRSVMQFVITGSLLMSQWILSHLPLDNCRVIYIE